MTRLMKACPLVFEKILAGRRIRGHQIKALTKPNEAARRLGVTRARMTQTINLTLLARDLQEEILFLGKVPTEP